MPLDPVVRNRLVLQPTQIREMPSSRFNGRPYPLANVSSVAPNISASALARPPPQQPTSPSSCYLAPGPPSCAWLLWERIGSWGHRPWSAPPPTGPSCGGASSWRRGWVCCGLFVPWWLASVLAVANGFLRHPDLLSKSSMRVSCGKISGGVYSAGRSPGSSCGRCAEGPWRST